MGERRTGDLDKGGHRVVLLKLITKYVDALSLAKVCSWTTDFDQCEIAEGYLGETKPSEGFSTRSRHQNSSQERYRWCVWGCVGVREGSLKGGWG